MPDLTMTAWAVLAAGAVLVGFAKTAIAGMGSVAVVLFAIALPSRESTGALLPLLIVGDLLAVGLYRRHASWPTLLRLVPGVVPGLVIGAVVLAVSDDSSMRRFIALTLLALTVWQLLQRWRAAPGSAPRRPRLLLSLLVGVVAGFTTMTANAGGPVMTLYLLLAGLPMLQMLGTGAWFFFAVNLVKVPFSAGLSLISGPSLVMDAALVPALLLGGLVGHLVIGAISQAAFERAALGLSAVAALLLLVQP